VTAEPSTALQGPDWEQRAGLSAPPEAYLPDGAALRPQRWGASCLGCGGGWPLRVLPDLRLSVHCMD